MRNEAKISFAQKVKEECVRLPREKEEERAFLSSFLWNNGYLRLRGGGLSGQLEIASEISAVAKVIYQYMHELYDVNVRFSYTRSAGLLKKVSYHAIVDEGGEEILSDLGIDYFLEAFPKEIPSNKELVPSFLAGAFVASGSVNDPQSTNYHLEIQVGNESYAKFLSKIWNKYCPVPFESKITKRRNKFIVYIKKSSQISDFLIMIGAKEMCLNFENIRVDRDFANIDNRLNNLDTANYGKTLRAGERQVKEIEYFDKKVGLSSFSNIKLRYLMKFRLEHPDMTLDELAHLMSEEFNTEISKSNINHLFRLLHQMYLEETSNE